MAKNGGAERPREQPQRDGVGTASPPLPASPRRPPVTANPPPAALPPPAKPSAASSASAFPIAAGLIPYFPPPVSLRGIHGLKVRHGSGTGSPPRDELHLRAGSFSWLVTFQQSNYHCRMRNSLINYYCQAGLCAMIIPSEANFLNIWKQKYYYN